MNNIIPTCKWLSLTFALLLLPKELLAQSITQLIEENKLTVSSQVKLDEQHIVGQPVTFSIEVASNRWFANGTRINNFALTDTVVLANSETTINGSKRIQGQTWTTQIREITLYPTRAGIYEIPPVEVFISVNTEKHGVIEGTTFTKAKQFTITLPDELKALDTYIVSTEVNLSISGEFDSENTYAVGEAVNRTITITAQNTPAMMLPPIEPSKLDGVSIYKKPSQVEDRSNRGTLIGTRTDAFTYIFEQPGKYTIPQQNIYWWNIQTNALETITVPEQHWQVAGKTSSVIADKKAIFTSLNIKTITWFLLSIFTLYGLYRLLQRYATSVKTLYKRISKQEQRQLANAFIKAIQQDNHSYACQLLYQFNKLINGTDTLPEHEFITQLKSQAFAPTSNSIQAISKQQGIEILNVINRYEESNGAKSTTAIEQTIKLN